MAEAAETSIVIPAFNEAASIGAVVRDLKAAAAWHEILVVDDGSGDGTSAEATRAGARVVRHPYNKGNGAAVKSGIRVATGTCILIADGDGQHRPADAARLGSDGFNFFLILLKVVTIFSPLRLFAPISAAAFAVGAAYGAWTILTQAHVTNSSVLLIVLSVVILLVGLVSEQISSLRFEGRPPR